MGPKSRGGGGGGGKKKDKGPRGRRARRKAKLDRRWGEEEEEEPSEDHDRGRRGRRRDVRPKHHDDGAAAVSSFSRNEETKTDERRRNSAAADDDDDEDDDDDRGVDGGGLQSLLQRIQSRGDRNGEKRKRKDRSSIERRTKRPAPTSVEVDEEEEEEENDDDDDDEESSDGDDVTSDESERESSDDDDDDDEGERSVENDEHEDDGDEDDDDEDGDNDNDPFTSHFYATPFETAEEATASVSRDRADHDAAIDVGAGLDPTLELRASGAALARSYQQETTTKRSDGGDATMPYLREALAARWSDFNAAAVERNADGVETRDDDDERRRRRRRRRHSSSASDNGVLTPLQARLCPALFSYADLLITAETRENRDALHRLAAAHVLNHVSTSRVRVKRHDRRVRELRAKEEERETERLRNDQQAKKKKKNSNSKKPRSAAPIVDDELAPLYDPPNEWKDQGFTRPKVLVLLPTRGACSSFVDRMAELCRVVEHRDRFEAEYGPPPTPPRDEKETPAEARRKRVLEAKGPEWNELFGDDVNDDDDFRIGLSLEGSGSAVLKLYTEFYKSDVVLASPLGLKMAALRRAAVAEDGDGDDENNDDDPAAAEDWDFLSSVEICLVLRADVALMQNWDHVVGVLERLNRRPARHNDADFSRVRPHLLVDQGAHRRQTVVCSALSDAQIASTFRRFATSRAGALRVRRRVPLSRAAVGDVLVPARQVFRRVPCEHSADRSDARTRFFLKEVLPRIVRARQRHTLVYVPSYFDFVTLRNALTRRGDELLDGVEFVSVTEYARVSEVSRGRARFLQGRKHLMLYTGRAHFFSRNVIKGATHLVFLGLPEHGEFYPGMVNELREDWSTTVKAYNDDDAAAGAAAPASCLALYTKYDAHEMERIVGTKNCERMIHGEKGTYMFC